MCIVTFLHPDLGIGGAERLIVDAALALKQKGHDVNIVTSHHDESHCFEETKSGQLKITVVGDWIPRHIFRRFYALMAYIRMVYAALYIVFFHEVRPDVIICDLASVAVPILKYKTDNVIFYCHYPDQLLSKPGSLLKKMYRVPLDWLEEKTTGSATRVFVNSKFTASVFKNTFMKISRTPDVLYPSLNTNFFDTALQISNDVSDLPSIIPKDGHFFLSINRFEKKKNLSLAIRSFAKLRDLIDTCDWDKAHLVIAGGYDPRVDENVENFTELVQLSRELKLEDKITVLKSPCDNLKILLLNKCLGLLYTPSNEHFGIVPLEAMYMKKPVIAANSGGPTETVVNNETGFLCDSTPEDFATAMSKFIYDKKLSEAFGKAGRQRVVQTFSFQQFSTSAFLERRQVVSASDPPGQVQSHQRSTGHTTIVNDTGTQMSHHMISGERGSPAPGLGTLPSVVMHSPLTSVLASGNSNSSMSPSPTPQPVQNKLVDTHTQILTRPRLQDLVREVDATEQLDEEVEELLLQLADDFVESTVNAACIFAKHRHANTVDIKDVQLHLERNWNMSIPGFGTDELRPYKRSTVTEAHKQRMALIRKTLKKY